MKKQDPKNQNLKRFGLVVALIAAVALWSQWRDPVRQLTRTGEFFGSYVKVDVCFEATARDRVHHAVDAVWERFADIHTRLSVYAPDSDINLINNAYAVPVRVGADTYQLIKDAQDYYRLSHEVFDITLGPLIKLWKTKGRQGIMPTDVEIRRAKGLAGMSAVKLLNERKIRLARRGVKVNIDSIGDGYAADEAARILRSRGVENFLVDASGELYAGGKNCQGHPWRIGIRDPHDVERLIDVIEVSNLAVSTSGSYERFYEIDGKRWSHIIDPRTGYPARGINSATVIGKSARFADFLSTALCVLNPEDGIALMDELGPENAAMLILDDDPQGNKRLVSRNYSVYQVTAPAL